MTTPQQRLDTLIDGIRQQYHLPAITAAIVHNFGAQKIYTAKGVRRADRSPMLAANKLTPSDRFNLGSISKPMTGFLMARLVKAGLLSWTTTIADAFPELTSAACRSKYGVRGDYLGVTIEQLMSQGSGMFDQGGASNGGVPRGDPAFAPDAAFYQAQPGGLFVEWTNVPALEYRRYIYAILAMQMPPIFPPGQGKGYGGAPMVCAAMAERKLGATFESLTVQHVFGPAGMTQSKFGRTATSSTPDGVYTHDANGVPNENLAQQQTDFNSHAPAGLAACSARDLALFIEQNLHAKAGTSARVLTDAELTYAQQRITGTTNDGVSRCGWGYDGSSSPQLWHTGDNGSMLAAMRIYPTLGYGIAAVATISAAVSEPAISAALVGLENIQAHWLGLVGA